MASALPEFLAERLAKAEAVPAEERSADVRAFIETCALQAELTEELGLPHLESTSQYSEWSDFWGRWSAALALKLVRSHFITPGGDPLMHSPQLQVFATYSVCVRAGYVPSQTFPSDLGHELAELLERDPSLETLAILAAGLPKLKVLSENRSWGRGLLKLCNRAVALMRRPAVRRRLRAELAALPHQLVSYEELMTIFIYYGSWEAHGLLLDGLESSTDDIRTALRLATELLPQLAPDNPRLRYTAACMTRYDLSPGNDPAAAARARYLEALPAGLDVALQQGSDFDCAVCGYKMACELEEWVDEAAVQQGLPPPSNVLGWLRQGEAARRRCRALLPQEWTRELDGLKALAAPRKAILQHMQRQGDCWRPLTPAEAQELDATMKECGRAFEDPNLDVTGLRCSGCGHCAPQLRLCAACREAQYCSVACQKAHWREHKARCKEAQAAKAAASGGASTSGGGS